MDPERFAVAVDLVILTVESDQLVVLCIRRGIEPFKGQLALPGGFVTGNEDLFDAALRELAEETAVSGIDLHMEQLRTYGQPNRDPRGRVISVAYLALVPELPEASAGSDASAVEWLPAAEALAATTELAFDHHLILHDGLERARAKLEYTPLAAAFCAEEFTINELRKVYNAVWDAELDPRNFHRKATTTPGFVTATGRTTTRHGGRPAQLYTRGDAAALVPPILRSRDQARPA